MLYDNLPINDLTQPKVDPELKFRLILPNFNLLKAVFSGKIQRCVVYLSGDGEHLVTDGDINVQYEDQCDLSPNDLAQICIPMVYYTRWSYKLFDESFDPKGPPLEVHSKTLPNALSELAFAVLEFTERTNWDQGRLWYISMTFDFGTGDIYYRKEMHYPDDPMGQFPEECLRENVWAVTGSGPSDLYLTKVKHYERAPC